LKRKKNLGINVQEFEEKIKKVIERKNSHDQQEFEKLTSKINRSHSNAIEMRRFKLDNLKVKLQKHN